MSDHRTPDAPGMWKAAHGGYGVMFDDDGEPAMLLFGPGAKVRALDSIGPYTRLHIRLSRNELGDLAAILRSITNEEGMRQ